MTLNDIKWLFNVNIRFQSALIQSERLNVKNNTTSVILWCLCALRDQWASLGRHAQLTRCFSAVAELLVFVLQRKTGSHVEDREYTIKLLLTREVRQLYRVDVIMYRPIIDAVIGSNTAHCSLIQKSF